MNLFVLILFEFEGKHKDTSVIIMRKNLIAFVINSPFALNFEGLSLVLYKVIES